MDIRPLAAPSSPSLDMPSPAKGPAREFEATLLSQAFEDMLSTASPADESTGSSIWRGFLAQAIGSQMAHGTGIGLAVQVERAIEAYGRPGGADR
ncbi:rod-binding protein [Jannaschia sp. Os4]|uniref:rod-binding protein n=1 Tax=Jannaschia sp. Os4 TaxID=2807617 RepID=UPI0019393CB0|nr:rod-binding protein [Jannaschia sp. Os4]MBM2575678.1 rod-binding protein [Jannaschia sp. Os4]